MGSIRRRAAIVLAVVSAGLAGAGEAAGQGGAAPGAPGAPATWTTGAKQGVGTSAGVRSLVWHTLAEGALTEVYYPTVDVANVRQLELVVTDGRTFADRETRDMRHGVRLFDRQALAYRQTNTDGDGRYRLVKDWVTDPERHVVLARVRLESLDGGDYRLFAHYDPSLANDGHDDDAASRGGALVAGDGDVASALLARDGFAARSSGYAGSPSDGLRDLEDDFDLDGRWTEAPDGNVVQTAEVRLRDGIATLALSFGEDVAAAAAAGRAALGRPFGAVAQAYRRGWRRWLATLDRPALPRDLRRQYAVAAMALRAHEDKRWRGAGVASLTVPWGQAVSADRPEVGGYHLVWARDLYQVATALLAAGDRPGAERALDYLFEVQQRPDGTFPQNSRLDGTPYWPSLQLDEVAYPLVLAWQLGRDDAATWRQHVRPAANALVREGPATPQERWEEEGGYSPSTIAAEVAGLVAAAALAERRGDDAAATLYRGVADAWQRLVDDWTFTRTGPLGDGRYYVRIDGAGRPDDDARVDINNGGGNHAEREIVDAGFLELVRLGVVPPDDARVAESLPEVDATIRVQTPNGPMWHRYNHDGYGEKANGDPYDGTGVGRLWPLLTGERGEYEIANGRQADEHLRTLARAANAGLLIPEQVWNRPDGLGRFTFGEGTGSATPLAWSMAQFVRLAHGVEAGRVVEQPAVVARRYAAGPRPAGPALELTAPADGATSDEDGVTVTGRSDARTVVVAAGGEIRTAPVQDGGFALRVPLSLGPNAITVVAEGADGGTSMARVTVTSTHFGERIGRLGDPSGDDHGRGTYVYPSAGEFNSGAFDLTGFGVHDDGEQVNFVWTLAGEVRNPWGGNQISVQRLNAYVGGRDGARVPALPGVNADVDGRWQRVIVADGFDGLGVHDDAGQLVARGRLLALPATRQVVLSAPKSAFAGIDLARAGYAVAMLSHAGGDEGVGFVRPVYDRAYWESTAGTDMWWIHAYRFGGGAGIFDGGRPSRDTDTRDPNVIDAILPPGASQGEALDWTRGAPVVLPYAALEP